MVHFLGWQIMGPTHSLGWFHDGANHAMADPIPIPRQFDDQLALLGVPAHAQGDVARAVLGRKASLLPTESQAVQDRGSFSLPGNGGKRSLVVCFWRLRVIFCSRE